MNEIIINIDYDSWAIKINEKGIIFNHEKFPNATPDFFAQCFIDILEKSFSVKFTKKEKDED